jgi:hypothetical protein
VKSLLRRRPSPAMVVALIALFVALGGVSYGFATGSIDTREIKNNDVRSLDIRNNEIRTRDLRNNEVRGIDIRNSTVQGRDIQLNTVTGDDVREDTLQKVPSALLADSATKADAADSAGAVSGVTLRRIAFSDDAPAAPGAFTEILHVGGLKLEARCVAPNWIEVRANPDVANGEFFSTFAGAESDEDFDPMSNRHLVFNADNQEGHAIYVGGDGAVVTIHGGAYQETNDVRGTTDDCGFFGIAEAG